LLIQRTPANAIFAKTTAKLHHVLVDAQRVGPMPLGCADLPQ